MTEFEEARNKAAEEAVNRQKKDLEDRVNSILTRLQDVESEQIVLEEVIKELTPTDDLEAVKMRLNQVISVINKLAI